MNKNNNLRNINANNPFTLPNNNNPSNYENIYNDTRNQTNIIDLISRQVVNNVLNILNNNNYNNNQNNQSNPKFSINNSDNNRDIFNKKIKIKILSLIYQKILLILKKIQ